MASTHALVWQSRCRGRCRLWLATTTHLLAEMRLDRLGALRCTPSRHHLLGFVAVVWLLAMASTHALVWQSRCRGRCRLWLATTTHLLAEMRLDRLGALRCTPSRHHLLGFVAVVWLLAM